MKNNILLFILLNVLNFNGLDSSAQNQRFGVNLESISFDEAVNNYKISNYNGALLITENILKSDSSNTNALLLKARLIRDYRKDYNAALAIIDKALKLEPENHLLLKGKIELLILLGSCKEAMDVFGNIPTETYDVDHLVLLSNIMICAKKPETLKLARHLLVKYMKEPDATESLRVMYQLANIYLLTDKDSAAIYFKECISLDPTNADYYVSLASVYLAENKNAEAKSILKLGIMGDCKNDDKLFFWLSKVYFYKENNRDSCLVFLNHAIEENKTEEYIVQRAEVFDSIGRLDLAYSDYKTLFKYKPWNLSYLKSVTDYEISNKEFSEAIENIKTTEAYDESFTDSSALLLMRSYFGLGNFEMAYRYVDKKQVVQAEGYYDMYIRALLLSSHSRSEESAFLCEEISLKKSNLNEEQSLNLLYLKTLLFLVEKKYESFYNLADKLYSKNKDAFIKSIIAFNLEKTEKGKKREITLISKGKADFLIVVSLTKAEYKAIKKRYNLP